MFYSVAELPTLSSCPSFPKYNSPSTPGCLAPGNKQGIESRDRCVFQLLKPPTTALCNSQPILHGPSLFESVKMGFLTKFISSQPLETNPHKIVLLLSLASQAFLSHNGWGSLMVLHRLRPSRRYWVSALVYLLLLSLFYFQLPLVMAYSLLVKLPLHDACPPLPACLVWKRRTKATTPTSRSFPKTAQDGQASRNKQTQRGEACSPFWRSYITLFFV